MARLGNGDGAWCAVRQELAKVERFLNKKKNKEKQMLLFTGCQNSNNVSVILRSLSDEESHTYRSISAVPDFV